MATTTSNFSWPIPQSTDLVKDGATAIASLGSGIDTSMAELKGGTTGQILSKTSGTDMDFTWITPNPGDITGVTAGTGITGGGTSGDVTVSFDIANYGGGQGAAGKNKIINGGFDIWQRGTSFVPSTTAFGPDRWQVYRNTTGCTASRQTPGSTLPQFQYCARMQRDSGTTAANSASYAMSLETSESLKYAGQTITLSFYARAGANFSGSGASSMRVYLAYGTGTDQNIISGFTGVTYLVNGTVTAITTSWVRYSFTVAVPSTATQLGLELNALFNGTAGAADYFEVTGVQLELGSSATPFSRAGGTIQGELAACQRYYIRYDAATQYQTFGFGVASSTTSAYITMPFPVQMRVVPTAIDASAAATFRLQNNGNYECNSISLGTVGNGNKVGCITAGVASGLTTGGFYMLIADNDTTAYLGWTAEL